MLALPISFDLFTRQLLDQAGSQLSSLAGKRGDVMWFELAALRNGIPNALPDCTILMGVKPRSNLTGPILAIAQGVRTGSGIYTRWKFALDLGTDELSAVINAARSLPVELSLEVEITRGANEKLSSLNLPFNIDGDVVRPDDEASTGYGTSVLGYVRTISSRAGFATLPTVALETGTIRKIVTTVNGSRVGSEHYLADGPADPDNPDHTAPEDYDPVNNNRHWEQISGLSA